MQGIWRLLTAGSTLVLGLAQAGTAQLGSERDTPPNVLIAMADDWSWPHAGGLDPTVSTPTFDRLAAEGVVFRNAFVASPSCTASRGAILTGRWIWQLEEGANLWGTLPSQYATFPDLLAASGYWTGHCNKGWGPGNFTAGGRTTEPAGPLFPDFTSFLAARPQGTPFCFWLGPEDPHRPYVPGSGVAAGMNPAAVNLPPGLPDDPIVRSDLCDYYLALERFDATVGAAIQALEQAGELENTLVIMTSDNGMPFPRAKANLYDNGTHVPLVIRWGDQVPPARTVDDFVNLAEIAPTVLDAAGLTPPGAMTGRSFYSTMVSATSGQIDPTRLRVIFGRERHVPGQKCPPWGYPSRAVRGENYLYIRNYRPQRLPAGTPRSGESYTGVAYADVDGSPTKTFMLQNPQHPAVEPLFPLTFGLRPAVELYDVRNDPGQLENVAGLPQHASVESFLATYLQNKLLQSGDPRVLGGGGKFDEYPYHDPVHPTPPLITDTDRVSALSGGTQTFTLDATPVNAGKAYIVLGSSAGTFPGIRFLGENHVPLNPSPYLNLTLLGVTPFLTNSSGLLDAMGRATIALSVERGQVSAAMVGTVLHHAYVVLDPEDPESVSYLSGHLGSPGAFVAHRAEPPIGAIDLVSNPCGVLLDH